MKRYVVYMFITMMAQGICEAQLAKGDPVIQSLLSDLTYVDEHGFSLLDPTTQVNAIVSNNDQVTLELIVPLSFLQNELDEESYDSILELVSSKLGELGYKHFFIRVQDAEGLFVPMTRFLIHPQIDYQHSLAFEESIPIQENNFIPKSYDLGSTPRGILDNKTVWLSAGHGWQYNKRHHCFSTQRSTSNGLVEDFSNAEAVNYYLLKYLYQAGANVWTVRERDMNENEVIVQSNVSSSSYKEKGSWHSSKGKGFNNKPYRYAMTKRKGKALARFTPNIPQSGLYWVSVRYVTGKNRTTDARYKVHHAGGTSVVSINQEVHGKTWVYIGQFYFDEGKHGFVELLSESEDQGQVVIADAVRFGGGKGSPMECNNQRESGEPRYEEAAKYYAQYQGFLECMSDVMVRPAYAEWELSKGSAQEKKNAVYVSWHSNASGQSGTETFVHNYKPVRGAKSLQSYIHSELVGDIKKGWDRNWVDRGKKSADFGELRGLKTIPGVLLEIGFHDNKKDAKALTSPKFRQLTARAVYKGIVRYFAGKQNRKPIFLPERPTHLQAFNDGKGKVSLKWKKPESGGILGDAPTAYKVFISQHGKAFGDGIKTAQTSFTFKDLKAGEVYYFRILALNSGGESFPTQVVAVRLPSKNKEPKYLIVDGFDRLDANMAVNRKESLPRFAPLGNTKRILLEKMNSYDYASEHAEGLASSHIYFDGVSNEVVREGLIDLKKYDGIDWYLGRESVSTNTLDEAEQKQLKAYLNAGGKLIISGSELAYHLGHKSSSKYFYENYFKASYKSDNANSRRISGKQNTFFNGIAASFNPLKSNSYLVPSPDVIIPKGGAKTILTYSNGETAAIAYRGNYSLVNAAFPLETISNPELRNEFFKRAIHFLQEEKDNKNLATVKIPNVIKSQLHLKMNHIPEGKAELILKDKDGLAAVEKKWDHNGNDDFILDVRRLENALYEYELVIQGRMQRGFVLKE